MSAHAATGPHYANFWQDDQTANPKLVRIDHFDPESEQQDIYIPSTHEHRQVHIHTLGVPHAAW